jgi:hypothetical protein
LRLIEEIREGIPMSEGTETLITGPTQNQEPFILGHIINSYDVSENTERVGFGSCLCQGATVGACVSFFWLAGILLHDKYGFPYNFLFLNALPEFLAYGVVFGIFQATLIWASSYVIPFRLGPAARSFIALLGVVILLVATAYFFQDETPRKPSESNYFDNAALILLVATAFGVVTGSKFNALRLFMCGIGKTKSKTWFVSNLSGSVLRLLVLYGAMRAILVTILICGSSSTNNETRFMLILLAHSIPAVIIVFFNLRFIFLSILASAVNIPTVHLLFKLIDERNSFSNVLVGYIALWAIFLLSRSPIVHAASKCVWSKFRYHLVP